MNLDLINYKIYGSNKKGCIVLLHGWGQNIEMMDMLGHPFEKEFQIIVLDLPGFGKTPEPDHSFSIEEYANVLHKLLEKENITNPILVGHSFGGRIAIKYASMYKVKKIVLLSAPFRPSKKKTSYKSKIYNFVKKYKCFNNLTAYLKDKWGSSDYKNASDINRGTLVKAVNEDLTSNVLKIKCPVLMIYGQKDTAVPISEGEALKSLLSDVGLIIYENANHYAYLNEFERTIAILNKFF